jgi:hypothetical protein
MCLFIKPRLLGVSNPAFLIVDQETRPRAIESQAPSTLSPVGRVSAGTHASSAAKSEGKISADNERTLMSIKGDERVPAHF